ncbi:hypothetical protein AAC387_Pa08g0215 [Persea americana]
MAVQAQYPSNVLLLNRTGQEQKDIILGMGGDYLQQGEFTHQNLMIDNGGVVNPRKRGREAPVSVSGSPANLFSLQPQHQSSTSMFVNLSQLNNQQHQGGVVSTGLGLSLEDQQHQRQKQQQQQQLGLHFPSPVLSSLTEDISAQIKHQRDEIDQLLQTQRDQLRRTLAERRERHYRALLGAAEESASRRLKEKDAEVEKAARRNAELEERAAHLKAEAQVWQARARAQESAAVSLQAQLQQAMMAGQSQDRRDELGCAGGDSLPVDDAESAHIDPRRSESSPVPPCRVCRNRAVSVVLLPCRHLCICTACEPVVHVCPLCCTLRNASVEVYLS